jgi:hypothetical protein
MNFSDKALFCDDLSYFYETTLVAITHVASFFLNLFCILVYFKLVRSLKDKHSHDLFKYLLTKSIVDTYISFLLNLKLIFNSDYSQKLGVDRAYGLKVFYLIFGIYSTFSLQLISIFLEVAAAFNRYRCLKVELKLFDRFQFKYSILSMFAYSFSFYAYKFVSRQVVSKSQNNTSEYEFKYMDLDYEMGYMHTIVRDGICVLAIILLNILTMYDLKGVLIRRRRFLIL